MTFRLLFVVFVLLLSRAAEAGDPEQDWQALVALDAGPQRQAATREDARALAVAHVAQQERALRAFLAAYPADAHGFEARLRLARLLEIRGDFENSQQARNESLKLFESLEKTATPEQRGELDFAQLTRLMRRLRQPTASQRKELLSAVRGFQAAHAGDRRVAGLLVEVATLFDAQPVLKIELLTDAAALASEPGMKARIDDDLRRASLLGKTVELKFSSLEGKEVNLEEYRGKPVFVVFFADFSPPSLDAAARIQQTLKELPKGSVAALGVCLDPKRDTAQAVVKQLGLAWPVACDEQSWEGALVRALGINALPTVWLLDQRGQLRLLNALGSPTEHARSLLRE